MELSVVVPTFNERENVVELIARIGRVLDGVELEVIVVDDDSPDGTAAVVREIAQRDRRVRVLRRVGRTGLSSACIEGMLAASGSRIAVMDADLQHDESLLPAMLETLRRGDCDLVVGTRHAEGGSIGAMNRSRARLSAFGKRLSRMISGTELSDPMSGFFMLDRRLLDEVVHSLSGVGFKILLDIVASARRPLRVVELPYHFRQRERGESKLDVLVGVEYLQLLADKWIGDYVPPRFVLFACVGAAGVVLHIAILYALYRGAGVSFRVAQLAATFLVMTANFFLNNSLTWRDHRLKGAAAFFGLLRFYAACSIGAWLNVQIAGAALEYGAPWLLAGVAGLAVGSVWNFAVTAATTWRRRRHVRTRRRAAAPAARPESTPAD